MRLFLPYLLSGRSILNTIPLDDKVAVVEVLVHRAL